MDNTAHLGFCEGYRLRWVPQHPYAIDLTWEPHWSRLPWDKMIKVRAISVHFEQFWSLCYGKHCSVGLLWGYTLESSPSNTLSIFALPMRYSLLWDLGFPLTSGTFVFIVLFHFFFLWTFLSSPTWFLLWFFHGLTFFFELSFFSRLQNSSQTCKFLFSVLYFFPNFFFFRTSIVREKYAFKKIQVRK